MTKDKILFLLQVPPPIHGASLRNLSVAESKLLQNAFNITLLPLRFVDEIKDIGTVSPGKFWRFVKFLTEFSYQIIFRRPRFIYFSLSPIGNAFYRDVIIVLIGTLFRLHFVFHLRGLGIRQEYPKKFNRFLYNFVFKGNFVICISKNQTNDIEGIKCRGLYVVPDGIKVEATPKRFQPTAVPEILYLSNYIKSKGVLDFIEALKILNQRGLNFKARLIGAPWDVTNEELTALAKTYKLDDKVQVGTPVYKEEKFAAVLHADIFVLPTYYELFPGVVLEAMQCAKPIVTTITGGIPEMIDDGINGLLVPTKSPLDVADKIEMLIRDEGLRERLGKAALEKFMNCYTLERYEENTKSTFEKILTELKNN
jgi:glycosyltransferase involved in cell wall biosynthesis